MTMIGLLTVAPAALARCPSCATASRPDPTAGPDLASRRNPRGAAALGDVMPKTTIRLLLGALALLAVLAPSAQASKTQTMTFEAPRELLDPDMRPSALEQIESLGARSLRVILWWDRVAPNAAAKEVPSADLADPASYDWGQYDVLLAEAAERGWPVILTVSGPVPTWATATKKGETRNPDPDLYEQFMTAVGRKYGEQIDTWSIWNEPNHPDYLTPQYRKGKPVSGQHYRKLFLAGWQGLRASGNGGDTVLMGETAPIGSSIVVPPLTFLRDALCLDIRYSKDRDCSNLPADGYAHHAYATRNGPFFVPGSPNSVTIGTLGRLTTALDRAGRAGAIRRAMPVYLTEFGVQSRPDKFSGVSLAKQAEYLAISERIAYDNPRVRSFSQYLLRDDDPGENGRYPGFETGLELANGKRKPSYAGFRLPLAVTKRGGRVSIWGRVRPATEPTTATVQVKDRGGTWKKLRDVRTDRTSTFTFRSAHKGGRVWRLRWSAPDGETYTGPPIRAYRRP